MFRPFFFATTSSSSSIKEEPVNDPMMSMQEMLSDWNEGKRFFTFDIRAVYKLMNPDYTNEEEGKVSDEDHALLFEI